MRLMLYKISQDDNYGYDVYESAVVAAFSQESARRIYPGFERGVFDDWAKHEDVNCELIGYAEDLVVSDGDVICASKTRAE